MKVPMNIFLLYAIYAVIPRNITCDHCGEKSAKPILTRFTPCAPRTAENNALVREEVRHGGNQMNRLLGGGILKILVENALCEVGSGCVGLELQCRHNDFDFREGDRAELVADGGNNCMFAGRKGGMCRSAFDPLC